MSRLAVALGARPETLSGLAGLGDLVLTCTGSLSRNRQVGIELGKGRALAEILAGMRMVAEGVGTAAALLALAGETTSSYPLPSKWKRSFTGVNPREKRFGRSWSGRSGKSSVIRAASRRRRFVVPRASKSGISIIHYDLVRFSHDCPASHCPWYQRSSCTCASPVPPDGRSRAAVPLDL